MGDGAVGDGGRGAGQIPYRSTVGGIFQGFQVSFSLDGDRNEHGYVDTFRISTHPRGTGEEELLGQIMALLTRTTFDPSKTDHDPSVTSYGFTVTLCDDQCHWFHRVRTRDHLNDKTIYIPHPNDTHSLLVLENTHNGLHVDPQGRWREEIGGQIGKLAATWALANMPAEQVKRSGLRKSKNSGWSDGFI